jgi:protoporphyrinogen oxidase
MLGGTEDPSVLNLSDVELTELISKDLARLFKTTAPPEHLQITRWAGAIPVYSEELSRARAALAQGFCSKPGRVVFNNYSKEVSIRGLIQSLNDL